MHISIARNVQIITYDTSTRNISFIAGFDRMASMTVTQKMGTYIFYVHVKVFDRKMRCENALVSRSSDTHVAKY